MVAVDYNTSSVPFTSSIFPLYAPRVPAWSIHHMHWGALCRSLQSHQLSSVTALTPQLEVVCQSSAIARE